MSSDLVRAPFLIASDGCFLPKMDRAAAKQGLKKAARALKKALEG